MAKWPAIGMTKWPDMYRIDDCEIHRTRRLR